VQFGDVVMLSVPWSAIPEALDQAGPLDGKIVIDTTNQFGPGGAQQLPGGATAAQHNQQRMPGARLVKSFNTLTSGFQASQAGRAPPEKQVVLFLSGDDEKAKEVVAGLIEDAGFAPADLGSLADAAPMEAPRRLRLRRGIPPRRRARGRRGTPRGPSHPAHPGRRVAAAGRPNRRVSPRVYREHG